MEFGVRRVSIYNLITRAALRLRQPNLISESQSWCSLISCLPLRNSRFIPGTHKHKPIHVEKTFTLLLWLCLINPSLRWGKGSKHQTLSMTRKYVLLEEELFTSVKLCSCNQVTWNSISKWHHMWERSRHFRIKYNLHLSKRHWGC